MQTEGIIKYKCYQDTVNAITHSQISDINLIRTLLHDLKLIGSENGIGYGNISKRIADNQFVISGSGTGANRVLSADDYSIVTEANITTNTINCKGVQPASSESLTHYAIYETWQNINFVVHIHNNQLWVNNIEKLPTTDKTAEYGTPEIALSIKNCILSHPQASSNIIVMGGHTDGLIFYSENLYEIHHSIVELMNEIVKE